MRQADLLSVEEARRRILDRFSRLPVELVALEASRGRVLGEPITAGLDLPPFPNSSMDGFALLSTATREAAPDQPVVLRVGELIAAGSPSQASLGPGEAARIMTGGPLPPGADAVVPFEEVEERDGTVSIFAPVPPRACVRPRANDIHTGEVVLAAGLEIGAPQIGLLAALGYDRAPVVRRPVVAVLATGDELIPPGSPLGPGEIYNSNTPMLAAAITEAGGDPRTIPAAGDDPLAIAEAVAAARGADLLLTSGGASVGDFDYVKDVVGAEGELAFWRVRIKPGKPLLFGSVGNMPVLGLPGNPTSAMVTFEEFARPAIRTMLGACPLRPEIQAILDDHIDNRGGRRTYTRVSLRYENGHFYASLSGRQDSAMLLPLAQADGLLIVPEDRDEMEAGESATVQVWRLPS